MLSPKKAAILSFCLIFASVTGANAGLYGFSSANPETHEEKILKMEEPPVSITNYRKEMRDNINALASYARKRNPNFTIIVHEGEEVLYKSLWEYHLMGYNNARSKRVNADDPSFLMHSEQDLKNIKKLMAKDKTPFADGVDGIVINNLICSKKSLSEKIKKSSLQIITIDHCKTSDAFDKAAEESFDKKTLFYGFLKLDNAFKKIKDQPVIDENVRNIYAIQDASNISFMIDDSLYENKQDLIDDIANSNYDIIVVNPLFHDEIPFTKEEISRLHFKKNGTLGKIIALQNISEAKKSEFFWKKDWKVGSPSFIKRKSFVNKNGFIVEYWDSKWRRIMSDYLKSIVDTGYDGVFFTGLENHLYFEQRTPLE